MARDEEQNVNSSSRAKLEGEKNSHTHQVQQMSSHIKSNMNEFPTFLWKGLAAAHDLMQIRRGAF